MSILIAATRAGFGLLAIDIRWVKCDIGKLQTGTATSRDRIDNVSERLARIETLPEERLPERRQLQAPRAALCHGVDAVGSSGSGALASGPDDPAQARP